jgi:hypothetical protein
MRGFVIIYLFSIILFLISCLTLGAKPEAGLGYIDEIGFELKFPDIQTVSSEDLACAQLIIKDLAGSLEGVLLDINATRRPLDFYISATFPPQDDGILRKAVLSSNAISLHSDEAGKKFISIEEGAFDLCELLPELGASLNKMFAKYELNAETKMTIVVKIEDFLLIPGYKEPLTLELSPIDMSSSAATILSDRYPFQKNTSAKAQWSP